MDTFYTWCFTNYIIIYYIVSCKIKVIHKPTIHIIRILNHQLQHHESKDYEDRNEFNRNRPPLLQWRIFILVSSSAFYINIYNNNLLGIYWISSGTWKVTKTGRETKCPLSASGIPHVQRRRVNETHLEIWQFFFQQEKRPRVTLHNQY